MPQFLNEQCVGFRFSIEHFYELCEILLSTLPCKIAFVIHLIIRNRVTVFYTSIISSQCILFFITMSHRSFSSCTAIPNSRNKVSCIFFFFAKTPIMLDVLKFSKKKVTHILLYHRNNTHRTENYVRAFRNENMCEIFVLHW